MGASWSKMEEGSLLVSSNDEAAADPHLVS